MDGAPSGKSISAPSDGIYIAWLEEMNVKNGKSSKNVWRRMEDDSFFVRRVEKNVTPDDYRKYVNSIEPRIQFTPEIDEDRDVNFADLSIKRLDNKFVIKVY